MTHHKHDETHDGTHIHDTIKLVEEAKEEVAHREDDRDQVLHEGIATLQSQVLTMFRALVIGVLLIALGAGVAVWRISTIAQRNRELIVQVEALNQAKDREMYETCLARNQTSAAGKKFLISLRDLDRKFVKTLQDRGAAKIVQQRIKVYEDTLASRGENPPCVKP